MKIYNLSSALTLLTSITMGSRLIKFDLPIPVLLFKIVGIWCQALTVGRSSEFEGHFRTLENA